MQYEQTLRKAFDIGNIDGNALLTIQSSQLYTFGIHDFMHVTALSAHIKNLTEHEQQQNKNE